MRLVDAPPRSGPRAQLYAALWGLAQRLGVTVVLATSRIPPRKFGLPLRRGVTYVGVFDHADDTVFLGPGHHYDPWVLAHELGHRAAHRIYGMRHGEGDADLQARKIAWKLIPPAHRARLRAEFERELPLDEGAVEKLQRKRRRK